MNALAEQHKDLAIIQGWLFCVWSESISFEKTYTSNDRT
jgi:hypothetical protein